jgi:membrane associated rhomboid family serine protease
MIIPIRTDYRMSHTPWVNYSIIGLNILLFVIGYHGAAAGDKVNWLLLNPQSPQLHQFFSAMFLHADWTHLLGNMLFLWVFGNAVNDRFGHLGYLMFYLAGGLLAGIGYILLSGTAPVLGASGAIAAVTGAYLVLLPKARVTMLLFLPWVIPFEISSLYFLLFQFLYNVWMSLAAASSGVAFTAHSAGYAFGIGVSAFLMAIKALPRDPYDLLNLLRTWRRRHRYRQMVGQGYDPYAFVNPNLRSSPSQWVSARTVDTQVPSSTEAREFELRRTIGEMIEHHDLPGAADKYLELVQIADDAVLPRQQQLDIANQLMASEHYPAAADAYERFMKSYGSQYDHVGDIYLMLGLLYGRYLHQYDRARAMLELAIEKLSDPRKLDLARGDMQALKQR